MNDSKFKWYVLVALVIGIIIEGMLLISPTPIVGEIAESLKINLGVATASVMLPFTLMVATGGIISGFILDKFGITSTFIVGFAIVIITSFLMPIFGHSLWGIVILRGLQGLACGPMNASGPRVAAIWFPINQRAMVQGFTAAAITLGTTIGLIVSPAIDASAGWNASISRIALIMIIPLILFIIMAFGPKSPIEIEEKAAPTNSDSDFKKVFGLPTFWLTLLSFFILSWVCQGYNDLTPGHIAVAAPVGLGLGAQVAGALMSTYTISSVVGSLASGFVIQKIYKGNYRIAITVSYILTAIFCASVLLPGVTSNRTILTICLILAGFFMGMPGPFTLGFVSSNYPVHLTGRVGGFISGLGIYGGAVAVAIGSFALGSTGFYTVSIIIIVCAAILGAIVGFGVRAPKIFENHVGENVSN